MGISTFESMDGKLLRIATVQWAFVMNEIHSQKSARDLLGVTAILWSSMSAVGDTVLAKSHLTDLIYSIVLYLV